MKFDERVNTSYYNIFNCFKHCSFLSETFWDMSVHLHTVQEPVNTGSQQGIPESQEGKRETQASKMEDMVLLI